MPRPSPGWPGRRTPPTAPITPEWGIPLTQPNPMGSVAGRGGRLPAHPDGVGEVLLVGGGLPRVPVQTAVARGILVRTVREPVMLDLGAGAHHLRWLPAADFGHGRHDLSGHTDSLGAVVQGRLVADEPEEREQCSGAPAWAGAGR